MSRPRVKYPDDQRTTAFIMVLRFDDGYAAGVELNYARLTPEGHWSYYEPYAVASLWLPDAPSLRGAFAMAASVAADLLADGTRWVRICSNNRILSGPNGRNSIERRLAPIYRARGVEWFAVSYDLAIGVRKTQYMLAYDAAKRKTSVKERL
jgi:hypothetical protein